jgi:hypothetical protein
MTETTQPLIAFVHVPKAAGMTVTRILQNVYGERLLIAHPLRGWPQQWPVETTNLIFEKRDFFQAFAGHYAFGIHELFNRPARYFTTVRNPLSRLESYYNFVRRWEIHHHHDVACRLDMKDFFQFMIDNDDIELGNLQCLLICGEKSFAAAKSKLTEHFDFAVPVSRLGEGLQVLALAYRWGEIEEVPRENTTEHKSKLDNLPDELHKFIVKANAEDQALYEFCQQSWQRLSERGSYDFRWIRQKGAQFQ